MEAYTGFLSSHCPTENTDAPPPAAHRKRGEIFKKRNNPELWKARTSRLRTQMHLHRAAPRNECRQKDEAVCTGAGVCSGFLGCSGVFLGCSHRGAPLSSPQRSPVLPPPARLEQEPTGLNRRERIPSQPLIYIQYTLHPPRSLSQLRAPPAQGGREGGAPLDPSAENPLPGTLPGTRGQT